MVRHINEWDERELIRVLGEATAVHVREGPVDGRALAIVFRDRMTLHPACAHVRVCVCGNKELQW